MKKLMISCIEELPMSYTQEELGYAVRFQKPESDPQNPECISRNITYDQGQMRMGSTDVGDVSWIVPTGNIYVTTMAAGTLMHSWTATAQGSHIACAGSLLGIALAKLSSFPVGKINFMQITPMTHMESDCPSP